MRTPSKGVLFLTHHVDEVVLLAAPGRVLELVTVPAPRPRDPDFRRDGRLIETAAPNRGLLYGRLPLGAEPIAP